MSSAANSGLGGLRRNKKGARWLGVCAGIADWLDVPATLVRIVFVICVLAWPTLILGYFILYFCLSSDIDPDKMKDYVSKSKVKNHFRKLDYKKPIRKNERDKRIAGVCSGIADYLEVSPFVVRAFTLGSLFVFGPFTFWAYVICAFVFDPDPSVAGKGGCASKQARRQRKDEKRRQRQERKARKQGFTNSYVNEEYVQDDSDVEGETQAESKQYSQEECSKLYQSMESRLRDIEAYMTSSKFRLHCEINRI